MRKNITAEATLIIRICEPVKQSKQMVRASVKEWTSFFTHVCYCMISHVSSIMSLVSDFVFKIFIRPCRDIGFQ